MTCEICGEPIVPDGNAIGKYYEDGMREKALKGTGCNSANRAINACLKWSRLTVEGSICSKSLIKKFLRPETERLYEG